MVGRIESGMTVGEYVHTAADGSVVVVVVVVCGICMRSDISSLGGVVD